MTYGPLVVMGVSGAGKSVIGEALATRLAAAFTDADSLHPQANVDKMSAGIPLTDEDRWPWLHLVGAELAAAHSNRTGASGTGANGPGLQEIGTNGTVVACSALKRSYRDAIRTMAPTTRFILLKADAEVLRERLTQRPGHFMPAALLASQLETLEALEPDEAGLTLTSEGGVASTVECILESLVSDGAEVRQ